MSDFESFIPQEAGESYDTAAFEKFKEAVKRGSQQAAKDQKQEQKMKKKEQKLVEILLKLIKGSKKKGQMFLVARLLEENIPPLFVLSIVALGHQEERKEAGLDSQHPELTEGESALNMSLALGNSFQEFSLPLEVKAEIDGWISGMFSAASLDAERTLRRSLNEQGALKQVIIDCAANVMGGYFEEYSTTLEISYDRYFEFCKLVIKDLFIKLKKQIKNQKLLVEQEVRGEE